MLNRWNFLKTGFYEGIKDVWLSATIFFYLGMLSVVGILISDLLLAVADPRIKLYR